MFNKIFTRKKKEDDIFEEGNRSRGEFPKCPVCGENPIGGEYNYGIVFGTTDGEYDYITCTHCNNDYKYLCK